MGSVKALSCFVSMLLWALLGFDGVGRTAAHAMLRMLIGVIFTRLFSQIGFAGLGLSSHGMSSVACTAVQTGMLHQGRQLVLGRVV